MKLTKREVLKKIMSQGHCWGLECRNCSYFIANECKLNMRDSRLTKIGAMAILRMFPEKKKPILQNLSRIRFSDGRFAMVIIRPSDNKPLLDFGNKIQTLDYLFNRTWEIVE